MKNLKVKMASLAIAVMLVISVMPSFAKAETNSLNAVILEKSSSEKIIYLEGLESTDFKYAFSDTEVEDSTSLNYTTCTTDSNGENVAYVEAGATIASYMYVTTSENTYYVVDLANTNSITEEEIAEIDTLTERIGVDTSTGTTTYISTAEDGTTITTTLGKIIITDEGDYEYQLIELSEYDLNSSVETVNEVADELYAKILELDEVTTMYEELSVYVTIRDNYNYLMENATWEEVSDSEILEPEIAQDSEKYLVLIQKLNSDGTVEVQDIQIMTCVRWDDEGVAETNSIEEETVAVTSVVSLPVTGEQLAIYIAFGVVIIAIIVIAIRMKHLKGKEDDK